MGIYTRSLMVLLVVFFSFSTAVHAQKKKKSKKNKKEQPIEPATPLLANQLDTVSYALGMGVAKNLMNSGMDSISTKTFNKGFGAVFSGDSTLIGEAEVQTLLTNYFQQLANMEMEKNLAKGRKFLAENKKRPGVDTLTSGLQYEVIREGVGPHPTATSDVEVHYIGKLIDGTVFDSSYDRGEPVTFNLGKVIPGWSEGLQLMQPGAKYILYIPPNLGYGTRGAGSDIPPNAVLIFEVELLDVK